MAERKDTSKIYKDFKYLNLKGLDLCRYENMEVESGMKVLEKELLKRVKPGIKVDDDILDEIDSILMEVFGEKIRQEKSEPWEEVNKKIKQMRKNEVVKG